MAKPGRRSRHNLKYWTDGEWLGFGPGAHSTIDGMRTRNVSGTAEYAAAVDAGRAARRRGAARYPPRTGWRRRSLPGYACPRGSPPRRSGPHYGIDLWAEFGAELQPFRDLGWLIYDEGRLRLTRAGMLLAHEIMAVFIRPASSPSA